MKKIRKILIVSLYISLIYGYNLKQVLAFPYSSSGAWGNYGVTDDQVDGDGDGIPGGGYYCGEGVHAYCNISRGAKVWASINANMYDMYGNKIADVLNNTQQFLAGTYVGLDIYEDKGYESWANYSVSALKITYICSKLVPTSCHTWSKCKKPGGGYRNCAPCQTYNFTTTSYETYEQGCAAGYDLTWKIENATACGAAVTDCSNKAVPPVLDIGGPSYEITYKDSNDIDTTEKTDYIYNTMDTINGESCTGGDIESSDGKNTREKNCTYSYNREKACINVKNGKVRYIGKEENCPETLPSNECDEKNGCDIEYEITYNDKYWKYFIPLNANSEKKFTLSMKPAENEILYSVLCQDYINKYDDYADIIVTTDGVRLPEITSDMHPVQKENIKDRAKDMVKNGCKYTSIITIPVVQKFYNELDNGINFKGFNFYYKPIDITDPFPNGLTNTSLWYDWNEDESKNPNISESYKQKTYIAKTSGNESTIRTYNKNNPYTSWKNMNVEGYSYFIKDERIVEKIDKTSNNDFYSLGCGPWNEKPNNEDGSKNYFYQPECDNS